MSFTLKQVTQRTGGGDITRTRDIAAAEPVIGRGTDCDIQLADLAVSLRHAILRQTGRGHIEVEAIGKVPFEVNGTFTTRAQLLLADRPKLVFGSHELNLAPGGKADEIVVTVSRIENMAGETGVRDAQKVFSLATSMFSRRRSAWILAAALLLICLAAPIAVFFLNRGDVPVAENKQPMVPRADLQWESGPLSPGHRFLAKDCQACHQKAFVSVRDEACLACHKAGLDAHASVRLAAEMRAAGSMFAPEPARDHASAERLVTARIARDDLEQKIHAGVARTFNHPEGSCTSCHIEHVGPAASTNAHPAVTADLIVENDCADCHGDLKRRLPDTGLLNVADWGHHPDFQPLVMVAPKDLQRVALSDHPRENSGLTFPHALHLSKTGGVARMAQELGRAAPACADCHRADASGKGFLAIEMVRDCSACHSLAFAREGGKPMMLPHGDPGKVVSALTTFYASASFDWGDRRRPGFEYAPQMPVSKDAVARSVRAVFARGGACYGCHTIIPPKDSKSLAFAIAPVRLSNRYLSRGGFDHSVPAHRVDAKGQLTCNNCHKAETSQRSSDLLLPHISECASCHGQSKLVTPLAASESCNECHGYHNPGKPVAYVPAKWGAATK